VSYAALAERFDAVASIDHALAMLSWDESTGQRLPTAAFLAHVERRYGTA